MAAMEESALKEALQFLRTSGYLASELALSEEHTRLSTVFEPEVPRRRPAEGPLALHERYSVLRGWVFGSLEPYKEELHRVLYPVFVICFLGLVEGGHKAQAGIFFHHFLQDHQKDHSGELYKMNHFLLSQEIDMAESLRTEKFRVDLSEHSYELLLRYLHKENDFVILEVINKGITFKVSAGMPSFVSTHVLGSRPLFPLDRETLTEMLNTGCSSALIGISALNYVASNISTCKSASFLGSAVMYSLPYSYLPIGLFAVTIGVGAKKNPALLGWAGFAFLGQLVYIIALGGFRATLCAEKEVLEIFGKWAIPVGTFCYGACICFLWGLVSEYPQCVHKLARGFSWLAWLPFKVAGGFFSNAMGALQNCARVACCFQRNGQVQAGPNSGQVTDVEMGLGRASNGAVASESSKDQ